eukprot:160823-Prymnesium_polylepis.1
MASSRLLLAACAILACGASAWAAPSGSRPILTTPGASAAVQNKPFAPLRAQRASSMLAAAAHGDGAAKGGTSATSMTVNLAKNIVGAGVLALAAGVSTFSGVKAAIVPALLMLLFLAGVSGYSFSLIARLGEAVGASTYRDTWAKIFGERSALLPAATVTFKTVVGALSYAIIIGDSMSSIASLCGAPPLLCKSNPWIIIMSAFVLLPLCLLRDVYTAPPPDSKTAPATQQHAAARHRRADSSRAAIQQTHSL